MRPLLGQILRFAAVGILATLSHVCLGLILAECIDLPVFWANLLAFCNALVISYFGNRRLTFAYRGSALSTFGRFTTVATLCLLLNQTIVFLMVGMAGFSYRLALILVVSIIPLSSFILNRTWVFKENLQR